MENPREVANNLQPATKTATPEEKTENSAKPKSKKKPKVSVGFFAKIPLQEQILFAKHLSIMLQAGMPIIDSLMMLKRQQKKQKTLYKVLEQLIIDVDRGQFLSTSMEQFNNIFGGLFINVIRVGEASGTLPENLTYIVEELEKKQTLNNRIRGAMIYPIIVLVAVLSIIGILIFVVFPKILPLFRALQIKLPLPTRILLVSYDFISKNWFSVSIGLLIFYVGFRLFARIKKVKYYYHCFLLRIPYLGMIITNINMANMTRTLSILLKSGIKIVESLEITANTLPSMAYQKELRITAKETTGGSQISKYLMKKPELFPPMLSQMIEVGENTGNLSQTLSYLSGFYENEVDEITKNLSTVLEPVLLIIMGVAVGFVALAIMLPIYGLTQNVST